MGWIKKYYLNRQLRDFVRKKTDKKTRIHTLKNANSICFFITDDNSNKVHELIKSVSIYKEKKITIIYYLPHKKEINQTDMPPFLYTISQKDIKWTGLLNEEVQKNIFSHHYDIFIDMDTKTDLLALYLKTLPNADFRIGGEQTYYHYFDFILCANEQHTMKDYMSNLELYTSKLKGI